MFLSLFTFDGPGKVKLRSWTVLQRTHLIISFRSFKPAPLFFHSKDMQQKIQCRWGRKFYDYNLYNYDPLQLFVGIRLRSTVAHLFGSICGITAGPSQSKNTNISKLKMHNGVKFYTVNLQQQQKQGSPRFFMLTLSTKRWIYEY